MRVVALFRVSTEKQASEGASLDAQERLYSEIAAREGWETVETFKGCESATQAASDRKVLQSVLACVRERRVDAVWVIEQSRLTRGDRLDVASLVRELQERGTKVIVRNTVRDLESIDDALMFDIQSVIDRAESARIKERMTRGKREKARRGQHVCGKPPFGYRNPRPGEPGRGNFQVVEEEAAVVRRIFRWRLEGLGERGIARRLNAEGQRAPRGQAWGKSTVGRLLSCPAYIGTAASGVWVDKTRTRSFKRDLDNPSAILVEGAHPAIIDRETWDAVRALPRLATAAHPRMLSGLLFLNGEPGTGDSAGGAAFYRGPRGMKGLPWLEERAVDDAVWDAFARLATGEEFVQRLVRESSDPKQMAVSQAEVEYLEEQVRKRHRQLENLLDMRQEGEIDSAQYKSRSQRVRDEMQEIERQLRDERAKAIHMDQTHVQRLVKAVQALIPGRARLTSEQKRRVLRSIVRRVEVAAEATGAGFARDAKGRVTGSGAARWRIRSVRFVLALPSAESPSGAYTPSNGGPAGRASSSAQRRDGKPCAAGQLAEAGARTSQRSGSLRNGGLATTP